MARSCLIYQQGELTHGMAFSEAVKAAQQCDLLVARSGQFSKVPELFEQVETRAYVDGNPGSTQFNVQQSQGEFDAMNRYQHLFTMGLNIGTAACPIPTNGYVWQHINRPVVMSIWPKLEPASYGQYFTTVSSWKGRATFSLDGQHSGEKSDNWYQFLDLPKITGQVFEIALRIDSTNHYADQQLFEEKGWLLTDPANLITFDDYRNFIIKSRAEFSVAHNRYVEFRTGWFSDRSALYLACGKPVLVQSTGIESHLPTDKGLLTYSTLQEAAEKIEEINRNYEKHCAEARSIAEEYFDSDKVLSRMLCQIGF